MFVALNHKLTLWASLATLTFAATVTVAASLKWGINTGLTLGFLAFLLLGGGEAACYLLTRRHQRRVDEEIERQEIDDAYSKSENNPTIR